jgi:hypothetical protein
VSGTLQRIVAVAHEAVDGCQAAGILTIGPCSATTAAASTDLVGTLDRLQIEMWEGPCLDAARGSDSVFAVDLLDDPRWPAFGPAAVRLGIRSVLAYSLFTAQPSALNLYAGLPAAFGATDRAQGQIFATLARLALDHAEASASDARKAGHLADALQTRELIGQAQGILIERERITPEQAFAVLRRASQHLNIKLREVARTLVETGETGDTTGRPGTR